MQEEKQLTVEAGGSGKRLDVFLSGKLDLSRSQIKVLIDAGQVSVDGTSAKASHQVRTGEKIKVNFDLPQYQKVKSENIPVDIIYEDKDVLVINKPAGMVVHPAAGNYSGTLVNALVHHSEKLSDISGQWRPGIVHRLDKDTSGVLVVARNNKSHRFLMSQWKELKVNRIYLALVRGRMETKKGTINAPIGRHPSNRLKLCVGPGGRKAVTHFKVLQEFKNASLLEIRLETGRTHQIRVHLAFIKHPVIGDQVYGAGLVEGLDARVPRQMLHAMTIGFVHPGTGQYMDFSSAIPSDMQGIIRELDR